MSEFKVGDRVRIKSENLIGTIIEISASGVWFDIETRTNKTAKFYDISVGNKNYIVRDYDLELIERGITQDQIKLEELEQRIEKLEKEVFKPVEIHDRPKETKPSLLSEDERVILRNIPKKYNWIVRDKDWDLFVFFNSMFMCIKKDELYNIEELLKGECGNE